MEAQRRQVADFLRVHKEKPVSIEGLGERDRWGRQPVRIRSSHDKTVVDLSHALVEAGLALADPGAGRVFCHPELLAFEETAREQRLGLWAEARYNPIPAERNELLRERVGSFVIVEGRVRSVGERKQTTYLNFGGHWAEDFTIIIPRKVWTLMTERGLGAAALKGQKIRARGILQSWQGTALTIEMPEMIERLEGNRLPR
ncbi:thermonuclease family protein [Microvirga sp. 2YAF29]|uniref:thermonuclease family protein n=1 Tax=Microvirga sp. 2YAF29 TaxID=3233031 RepID=UPI003F94DC2F